MLLGKLRMFQGFGTFRFYIFEPYIVNGDIKKLGWEELIDLGILGPSVLTIKDLGKLLLHLMTLLVSFCLFPGVTES